MQSQKQRKVYSCTETFIIQTWDDIQVQVLIDEKMQER